jgi:hypothetical protein
MACAICVTVGTASVLGIHPADTITDPKAIKQLFFSLGFVFPAVALLLSSRWVSDRTRFSVAVAGLFLAACYICVTQRWGTLPFVLIEALTAMPLVLQARREADDVGWASWAMAFAIVGGWSVAATIAYVVPISDFILSRTQFATGPAAGIAFVLASAIATWTFTNARALIATRLTFVADVVVVAFIGIASWRRDLPYVNDSHHVSFFAGPVEAIRQGHWLLWDVPSQYGAENLWLIGHLPDPSGYAAVVHANIALMFAAAAITYAVSRTWAKAPMAALFCGATIVAADYFVGGVWFSRLGPEHYPSVGPMRFIWCYALIGVMVLAYIKRWITSYPLHVLAGGLVCWLAACWWSAESAIFATVIWLPTAIVTAYVGGITRKRAWQVALISVLSLAATVIFVELIYVAHFGHGPDWLAFIEFGNIYQAEDEGVSPLTTLGGAWLLTVVFAAISTIALYCWHVRRLSALPLLIAAITTQWATASYFVIRSNDNNVDNLIPIQILVIFATIAVIVREEFPAVISAPIRLFAAPITAVACAVVFYVWPFTHQAGYFVRNPGNLAAVAPLIPEPERILLTRHNLGATSPVLYFNASNALLMPPGWPSNLILPRMWAPALPALLIGQLPVAREITYLHRFAESVHETGYAVSDSSAATVAPNLQAALAAEYIPVVIDHEGQFVLTRYDHRP